MARVSGVCWEGGGWRGHRFLLFFFVLCHILFVIQFSDSPRTKSFSIHDF